MSRSFSSSSDCADGGCKSYVSRFNHSIKSRNFNKGDFSVQLNLEKVNNPNCAESPRFNNAVIRKETDRYFINIDLAQFEAESVRVEPNGDRIQVRASYKLRLPGRKTEYGELSHSYRLPRAEIATVSSNILPDGQLEIEVPYHGKSSRSVIRHRYPRITSDGSHVTYSHVLPSRVNLDNLTVTHADNKIYIRSNTPGSFCYYHSVSFPSRADLNTLTRTIHGNTVELTACYDPLPSPSASSSNLRQGSRPASRSSTHRPSSSRAHTSQSQRPASSVNSTHLAVPAATATPSPAPTANSTLSRPASQRQSLRSPTNSRATSGLESGVTNQADELQNGVQQPAALTESEGETTLDVAVDHEALPEYLEQTQENQPEPILEEDEEEEQEQEQQPEEEAEEEAEEVAEEAEEEEEEENPNEEQPAASSTQFAADTIISGAVQSPDQSTTVDSGSN